MEVLYVTSAERGVGKTALCATLAHKLALDGRKVVALKPVGGVAGDGGADPDVAVFEKLLGQSSDGWPLLAEGAALTADALGKLKAAFEVASAGMEVAIVEGSSGLSDGDAAALVEALDARVIVVVAHRPGLAAGDLAPWRQRFGDRLQGFVVNSLRRYQGTDARTMLLPSLESEGMVSFGLIPEDRRVLGVSVGEIAAHLSARFLSGEDKKDRLVEHFLVGCLTMDPGELYFGLRQDKAAIIRGDRPDIQMACLATPTACMVLTNGAVPIEYVINEAEEEDVPLLMVETDTLATMDSLDTIMQRARFDHPAKLARFSALLDEHVDMRALHAAMGLSG